MSKSFIEGRIALGLLAYAASAVAGFASGFLFMMTLGWAVFVLVVVFITSMVNNTGEFSSRDSIIS
jgi:uncharacterized membrane protein